MLDFIQLSKEWPARPQKVIKMYQKGESYFFKVKINRSTENNVVTETLAPYKCFVYYYTETEMVTFGESVTVYTSGTATLL
jgi:hypothetical protein